VESFMSLAEKVGEQGILLSVKGDTYPLGGHIHVGSYNEYVVEVLRNKVEEFVSVLDEGLVETLLRKGKLSYKTLEDGRAREEEYYSFLTKEETNYFLAFPQRWEKGEISPFVPVKNLAVASAAE